MSKPISFNYDDYRLLVEENSAMKMKELDFVKQINNLEAALKECRNELCLRCGEYQNEPYGACVGCKWRH